MDERWSRALNVLCVRLDSIGDVLMTTPAIRALKSSQPERTITLLTSNAGAAAAALVPEIDDIIPYEAPWMKSSASSVDVRSEREIADLLTARRFDAAVVFTVFTQSALPAAFLCRLARIPLRLAHCRENPYEMLTDWVRDPEPEHGIRHEVRRQLDLVASVGCTTNNDVLSLTVPETARASGASKLTAAGVDLASPWCVIHPGSTAPSRRYAPASFAAAARALTEDYAWQCVFTGDASEAPLIEQIREEMRCPSASLAAELDLPELAAVISLAPVLITNNTGPAHIAAAVGTPVVDLYALTNPQHTPWRVPSRVLSHDVPCKYCYRSVCPEVHHNCLRLVAPNDVVAATLELMREVQPSHPGWRWQDDTRRIDTDVPADSGTRGDTDQLDLPGLPRLPRRRVRSDGG